jgi:hypothetical protein
LRSDLTLQGGCTWNRYISAPSTLRRSTTCDNHRSIIIRIHFPTFDIHGIKVHPLYQLQSTGSCTASAANSERHTLCTHTSD